MALTQGTFFPGRAILASNNEQLNELYRNKAASTPPNQRQFRNFSSIPAPSVAQGVPAGRVDYVVFNGTYPDLSARDHLDLAFLYYCTLVATRKGMCSG